MDNTDFRTPGQLVEALLEERDWTQQVLALVLGVDRSVVNKIVSGRKRVDAEMAIALNEVFGVSAERFLDLQKLYDLAKAQIVTRPDPGRANRAHLFGNLPVSEMVKRGWIEVDDIRNMKKVEAALVRFFGVSAIDDIEILPHAAKKTAVAGPATPRQLAWIYRVKQIAEDMIVVGRYSRAGARSVISELKTLLFASEEARNVPRILSGCGIRFVIVESLASAKIDGVSFWLDNASPVIGMSFRYDRIDNFWFVLRHELEHVVRHHGKGAVMLDAELEGDRAGTGDDLSEEERVANRAAAQFCVPQNEMKSFIARKDPLFRERDVLGFSRTLQVHPGIIVGQLQRHTGRYDLFRKHLTKMRALVAPAAIVDGWGDIAPVELGG